MRTYGQNGKEITLHSVQLIYSLLRHVSPSQRGMLRKHTDWRWMGIAGHCSDAESDRTPLCLQTTTSARPTVCAASSTAWPPSINGRARKRRRSRLVQTLKLGHWGDRNGCLSVKQNHHRPSQINKGKETAFILAQKHVRRQFSSRR